MTATTSVDVDRYQRITTPDGLTVEGAPRWGMHVQRDCHTLASYYRGDESQDALAALRTYRAHEEGREPLTEN